jgi:hypothetical protein
MNTTLAAPARTKRSRHMVNIRETLREDYAQIASLQTRNGLCPRSYEDWVAIWADNPVYKRNPGRWPIGWVLETDEGEIVGSIGNIPLEYEFRGKTLRGVTSSAWVVDTEYRNHSMSLMSYLIRQKDADLFTCTTVTSASEHCYCAFQFSKVPVGSWDRSSFWITNYHGFSQSALSIKPSPISKAISSPISAALFCWDKIRKTESQAGHTSSEIELCSGFDWRFDDFWEELTRQKQHLLTVRTRETLEWHFRYSRSRQNAWIVAISEGSRLIAYAIFDRLDHPTLSLKRVRLVDFQALNGFEKELGQVLFWGLRKCREERIHVLEDSGRFDHRAWRNIPAPYQRTLSSWMYYYKAADNHLARTLLSPAVWAPSSFDGDASL